MTTAGSVSVDFEANTARFVAEVGKVRQAVQETQQATTQSLGLMRSALQLAGAAAGGFIGAFSIGQLLDFGTRAVQTTAEIQTMSTQLGLSTRALQVFGYSAASAGVAQSQLQAGLLRFNATIGEAAQGNSRAIETFNRLGVHILDANGALRPTEMLFGEIADAIARIEDPARRAALAQAMLGESGARLLPVLEGGSAGLRRMSDEATATGAILTDQMIARARELAREWEVGKNQMAAWGRELGINVMQYIRESVREVDRLRNALDRLFNRSPAQQAGDEIGQLRTRIAAIDAEISRIETPGPNQPRGSALPARVAALRAQRLALIPQIEAAEARYAATAPSEYTDLPPGPRSITYGGGVSNPRPQQRSGRAEQVDREAQAYERLSQALDPAYRAQQDYLEGSRLLDEMQRRGTVTEAEYDTRLRQLTERFEGARAQAMGWSKALQGSQDTMRDANQAARDLGLTFSSAFESALIKGESLRSVLGGILSDIGRIAIRFSITNPLASALQQGASWLFGGGATSRASGGGSYSASATGNVLGPRGPIALASGGIVDAPHVALIGEGAMNEAVVPLPDGRRIPVDVRGGGGGGAVMITNNIDARGAEAGAAARLRAVADQIVAQSVAAVQQLARAGGQFSRDVGARRR